MRSKIHQGICGWLVAVAAVLFFATWGHVDVTSVQAELTPAGLTAAGLATGGLISHFHDDPNGGPTRVIVIDPAQRRMAVYQIPVDSGAIQLKSVRNLTVDLQVQAYNSDDPSPVDMQKLQQLN